MMPFTHSFCRDRVPVVFSLLFGLLLGLALTGCASWLGHGDADDHPTLYAPNIQVAVDPAWPTVAGSVLIATPTAAPRLDSPRILVRTQGNELQLLRAARWARTPPEMVQDALLHTLEDSGKLRAVARQGNGVTGDVTLLLDLRRFEADYSRGAVPTVEIVLSAKLISRTEGRILSSRTFSQTEPAAASSTEAIMTAFGQGLEQVIAPLVHWVLESAP